MLGGDLDVFQHALADRDAGHDDDEFLEAVSARKFEDGPQVNVGLAGAGFHLDGKVRTAPGRVGSRVEQFPCFQGSGRVGNLDVVAELDGAGVGLQLVGSQEHLIADAKLGLLIAGEKAAPIAQLDDGVFRCALRLAVE